MAISLSSLKRGPLLQPPKIIVFGPEGVGKSTFAFQAPAPIVIKTEEGQGRHEIDRFTFDETGREIAREYQEVLDALKALGTEKHQFKTLVIDSLTSLEPLIHKHLCRIHNEENIQGTKKGSGFGFNKGVQLAAAELGEFLKWLDYLNVHAGMMVILIAHSTVNRVKNPEMDDFDSYEIHIEKEHACSAVKKWATDIFFARYETPLVTHEDVGFNKTKAKAKGSLGSSRVLLTEHRAWHTGKNRHGIPYEVAFPEFGVWDTLTPYLLPEEKAKKKAA